MNSYFKWDEDFQTGNKEIDKQHYELVKMINELLQMGLTFNEYEIKDIMVLKDKLGKYVRVHFSYEEGLMERYGIEEQFIVEHKVLHEAFIKKVAELFEEIEEDASKEVLANISEYLIRWLAYHILNSDKSLVRQLDDIIEKKLSPKEAYEKEYQNVENSTEPLLKALKVLYRLVSEKNKEVEEKNVELEKKVAERTKELEDVVAQLKSISETDELTGLYNRRYVMEALKDYNYEWERYKVSYSLLFIDIDGFKQVNDLYGHDEGDRVLVWVSQCLKKSIRRNDIACRLGGDEFVVICQHTSEEEAIVIANKLSKLSNDCRVSGLEDWKLSLSIGIAAISEKESVSELLKRADKAMYKAKVSGGGQVSQLG